MNNNLDACLAFQDAQNVKTVMFASDAQLDLLLMPIPAYAVKYVVMEEDSI